MGPVLRWVALRLQVRLAYRGDVLFELLASGVATAAGLLLIHALFARVPDVRGWTVAEVLLAWGLAECALGLSRVLFGGAAELNRHYLLDGALDRVLLRPVDPLLQVLLEHLEPRELPVLGVGLGAVALALALLPPVGAGLLLLPVFVLSGALVVGGLMLVAASSGFWVQHPGTATGLVGQLAHYARFPLDLLPRPLALLVQTAVPLAFAGFLPAAWLAGRDGFGHVPWLQPLVGLACALVGVAVFRAGLRRYASSGH